MAVDRCDLQGCGQALGPGYLDDAPTNRRFDVQFSVHESSGGPLHLGVKSFCSAEHVADYAKSWLVKRFEDRDKKIEKRERLLDAREPDNSTPIAPVAAPTLDD